MPVIIDTNSNDSNIINNRSRIIPDTRSDDFLDLNGITGTSGTAGTSGTSGTAGTAGTSGTTGTAGTSGTAGAEGTSGTSGTDGGISKRKSKDKGKKTPPPPPPPPRDVPRQPPPNASDIEKLIFKVKTMKNPSVPNSFIELLPIAIEKYKINTPGRMAHFLGQLYAEASFRSSREDTFYRVKTLLKVFPSKFTPSAAADRGWGPGPKSTSKPPKFLPNKKEGWPDVVYGSYGALGHSQEDRGKLLGPRNEPVGYFFRGGGPIQLTGRDNYTAFDKEFPEFKILEDTDKITNETVGWLAALNWWKGRGETVLIDTVTPKTIKSVGGRVNGKTPPNGAEERKKWTTKIYEQLK